jgi:hypothetical protein
LKVQVVSLTEGKRSAEELVPPLQKEIATLKQALAVAEGTKERVRDQMNAVCVDMGKRKVRKKIGGGNCFYFC